jgi:hypothetical protein
MTSTEDALVARKTWRTVEPLHGMIYFVPEAAAAYETLGITGRDGYFASRAAPMGAVSAEVVIATFFNFNPELVHAALPAAWAVASPESLVAARLVAVDGACRRLLGHEVVGSDEMARAAELARTAAEVAAGLTGGRPLAAAHAGLEWPEAPHLVLWHAQSILREYRGDGHIALLVTHGLSGIDALITHGAAGDVPLRLLRSTRGWSNEQWDAAVASMRERGWLAGGDGDDEGDGEGPVLSEWGQAQRQEIEDQTDALAAAPYAALGEEACAELRALARPWSRIFSEVLGR